MALRADTSQLIAGSLLASLYPGHGVRGDAVPSTGTHGASPVYNDLTLPADAAKEYRWVITAAPPVGTLVVYEDCSFTYTPPPGTTDLTVSFTYRLYEDGVDLGTTTHAIVIGSGATVAATFAPSEGGGSDVMAAQASVSQPVAVVVAATESGDDLLALRAVQGAAAAVSVVMVLAEGADDVFNARGGVGTAQAAGGAITWRVPPEYRTWPVI